MESPSSEASSDSSDTTSADSSADSSPAQAIPSTSERRVPAEMDTTVIDNDDSASDVSMSADSDEEDDQPLNTSAIQVNPVGQTSDQSTNGTITNSPTDGSKKRKHSSSAESPNGQIHMEMVNEDRKRLKPDMAVEGKPQGHLPPDKSLLPAEIWHHIFTFCAPRVLGILLQVNRSFHAYLDPSSDRSIEPLSRSVAKILTPDDIWRVSRRLFNPGMPNPLAGKSELDMLKMACGSLCQFCGKKRQNNTTVSLDQWRPGPGENGVTPVWSFGIRTCGSCLRERSAKEIDLLLSSSIPSPLMAALPFVFLTNELHVLPSATLQSGQHPPSIQITKQFSNSQVEEIKREFETVKAMGSATVEEWLKGLDDRGKERRNDASRWERWEVSGGVERIRSSGTHETGKSEKYPVTTSSSADLVPASNGHTTVYSGFNANHQPTPQPTQPTQYPTNQGHPLPMPVHNMLPANPPPRFDSPAQNGFGPYPPRSHPQHKHERTKEEVAELKAARRAEIERRCMLLEPPLTAGVLAHMASFQAAIQIIQPLTDSAWEVLKPRLLSQREEAEQRENDRLAQTRVVQERFGERRNQDNQSRADSKDLVDREWEDIQAPLRARIGGYADEIIRDGWNGGEKVSSDNGPLFAAEVLIYVRKRFYAEVAKDEAALRATGREPEMDPPNGPYTRKLILENMKWVFDTKIKPITEPYRKELFLCNACDYASKYYGFEGIIQHYAAKHTSALSMGSIVVYWKSEWPEYPPFNPDPNNVKPYYGAVPSASVPYASTAPPLQQNYGYGGYQPAPASAPIPAPNPHIYQESPGPYYGHPQFGDQYSGHQNGPYAPPPQPYQDSHQAYQAPPYSVAPPPANISGYNDAPVDYSQQGFGGSYPASTQGMYVASLPGAPYSASGPEVPTQQPGYAPQGQYGQQYSQPSTYQSGNYAQIPPQMTEEYKAQLQHVARNSRDVWNTIHGVKDVPGSVKVYTIIHHLLKRFQADFHEDPPLSMIVDGLSNNKDMRPVRNVNGLLCKACTLGMAGSTSTSQKKHFSFPQLVNHFHSIHEEGIPQNFIGHVPDWTKDMVELPDASKLATVANVPGMDDQKLKLFLDALPEIVAAPVPTTRDARNGSGRPYGEMNEHNAYPNLAPSQDNHDKYYTTVGSGRPSEAGSVTYDSGEYDPRNPSDLPEPRPLYRTSRQKEYQTEGDVPETAQPSYRYARYEEEPGQTVYHEGPDWSYVESRPISPPSQVRSTGDYGRIVLREAAPIYEDRHVRYRGLGDAEYPVRRERPILAYDEPEPLRSVPQYRLENSQSYHSNRQELPPASLHVAQHRDNRSIRADDAAAQQNRIYEVVAQISQQAQQARERQPARPEPVQAGSEDGEVQGDQGTRLDTSHLPPSDEATNAAERFLNEFRPGEPVREATTKAEEVERSKEAAPRPRWEDERGGPYQAVPEPQRQIHTQYEEDDRALYQCGKRLVHPDLDDGAHNTYVVHERAPPRLREARAYAYEDRHFNAAPEQAVQRERSPELVDRRYKLNNVVYRDERQSSHGTHRTPSRYARYESVRLENDRARSRSPVYVKIGPQPGQYRERSPGAHPLQQEQIYRNRTPQPVAEEVAYERAPRQEYYRVYADEPRPREPQYAEAFEYVRVSDPQGDYMIRRPVRREPEPVYAFKDEVYARQPVYETRAPAPRADPAFYEEEYDPRHPAPPPASSVRQVRYQ